MIEIKNLTKKYGDNLAVDNVSFNVKKGEILGFLGPNGAGKSTTMNILTGYLSMTGGTVLINGYDILDNPLEAKRHIGYLPEQPPLYLDMTVYEYLDFVFELKQVKKDKKQHLSEIMEAVKIISVKERLIKNLSKGYKQRVGMAQAMIGNPEVLVLDEPTVGLDPNQIIEIRDVIKELGREHTIILSSHILQEVSAVCDRIVIINKGKIVASDTAESLSKTLSSDNKFRLRISGAKEAVTVALSGIDGIRYIKSLGEKEKDSVDFIIEAEPDKDIRAAVFNALAQNKLPILFMNNMDLTLEDVFLEVTKKTTAELINEDEIEIVAGKEEESKNESDI